ncbi:hypothetical protein BpHYR1_008898 [Brachionus plicatilis]|uniref:Uncharacterized protein n=1 Tax=Brachionus plicatilis TaxID=10195 RepID=A0A3M7RQ87_BRAPC|nr:hypothetical protein BpHYR1_008898 [Brachionus plicatilis]
MKSNMCLIIYITTTTTKTSWNIMSSLDLVVTVSIFGQLWMDGSNPYFQWKEYYVMHFVYIIGNYLCKT